MIKYRAICSINFIKVQYYVIKKLNILVVYIVTACTFYHSLIKSFNIV